VLLVPVLAFAATTACGGDDGDLEAFCATARRFAADNPAAVFDHYDPADPASAATLLRDAGDRLTAWAEEAPGNVDDDVEAIAAAAEALADEFEQPAAATTESLQEQVVVVEAASARVLRFTRDQCQVDLDPGSTTSSTAAPPSG
jgi:hypothetical protein